MLFETEQLNISSTHLYVHVYGNYAYKSNLAKSQIIKKVMQSEPHCHVAEVAYLWTMGKKFWIHCIPLEFRSSTKNQKPLQCDLMTTEGENQQILHSMIARITLNCHLNHDHRL